MKIFVSWSGELAEKIASVVAEWIPVVFPTAEVWISSRGISAGQRSMNQIEEGLKDAQFGIICVTPQNKEAPWLNFEAGAISNSLGSTSRVAPLLTGFSSKAALSGPLSLFQASLTDQEGFISLAESINETLVEGTRTPEQLSQVIEALWPSLNERLEPLRMNVESSETTDKPTQALTERSEPDMVEEILLLVRDIQRREEVREAKASLRSDGRLRTTPPNEFSPRRKREIIAFARDGLGEPTARYRVDETEDGFFNLIISTDEPISENERARLKSNLMHRFSRLQNVRFRLSRPRGEVATAS